MWQKSKLVTYCGVFALMFIIVTTIVGWLAWKTRMILTAGRCSGVDGCARSQTADAFFRAAATKPDNCLTCHQGVGEAAGVKYAADVHYKKGIAGAGCHGGDPTTDDQEQAMSAEKGFLGVPKGDEISKMCQRCHSDAQAMKGTFGSSIAVNQLEELTTSIHGKMAISGKEKMVQCVTCHGVHNIKSVSDPQSPVNHLNVNATCGTCHSSAVFMRAYNPALPIDQAEKYKTSVHGMKLEKGDTKVAVCSSCHGSHDILKAVDAKSHVNAINLPATCGTCQPTRLI